MRQEVNCSSLTLEYVGSSKILTRCSGGTGPEPHLPLGLHVVHANFETFEGVRLHAREDIDEEGRSFQASIPWGGSVSCEQSGAVKAEGLHLGIQAKVDLFQRQGWGQNQTPAVLNLE